MDPSHVNDEHPRVHRFRRHEIIKLCDALRFYKEVIPTHTYFFFTSFTSVTGNYPGLTQSSSRMVDD